MILRVAPSVRTLLAAALCATTVLWCREPSSTAARLFWSARQAHGEALQDAASASPQQAAEAIAAFDAVAARAQGTVWAARAHAVVGSLHALRAELEPARDAYQRILQDYPQQEGLCQLAQAAIAKTYELKPCAQGMRFRIEHRRISISVP